MLNSEVPYVAILAAAAVYVVLGFIWYSEPVFGSAWLKGVGKSRAELGAPGPSIALTVVAALISAFVLSLLVTWSGASGLLDGALVGLLAGLGLVSAAFATDYVFAGRSRSLYLINSGYHLTALTLMGTVMGGLG